MLKQKEIKQLFLYKNGSLWPRFKTQSRHKCNEPIGCIGGGYLVVSINGIQHSIHRLIWVYLDGDIPDKYEIDHINHNKLDNNIGNLRAVTRAQNNRNRPQQANNTSGVTGVSWSKSCQKWEVRVQLYNKSHNLGYYASIEKAAAIRAAYLSSLSEFHPNHGN